MPTSWLRGGRLLVAVLALLANFANPAIAVLHGREHAHEHAAQVAQASVHAEQHGPNAAVDHAAAQAPIPHGLPTVGADDDGAHEHGALHADLTAKRSVDVAVALPARAPPPPLTVVPALVEPSPAPQPGLRFRQRVFSPSAPPRAPPLG